jgi:hypothetical protein
VPVIPAFGRLRQKNHKFQASLSYIIRPWLIRNRKRKEKKNRLHSKIEFFLKIPTETLTLTPRHTCSLALHV